ncbi:MAG: hypothetical protein MJZ30_06085 [Paludibacteraceae bacterium]|nr:hypothetical protein [Paludibacteraceae bacterium]
MDNKVVLGEIFCHIGNALKDKRSELYNSVVLSNEQMAACLKLLKVASAPQVKILYIGDLAMRYGKSDRTIWNWIRDGAVPKGRKFDCGDNRDYWLSNEMYKVDEKLVNMGYVKRKDIEKIDDRLLRIIDRYYV